MLLAGLVAGCTTTVAGHANPTPPPLVERALPSPAELADSVSQPMLGNGISQVGGLEALRPDDDAATPSACADVPHAGSQRSYRGAPLRIAARGFWKTPPDVEHGVTVVVVVAEMDSAASTLARYAAAATQWGRCRDVTVTERLSALTFIEQIRSVGDSEGMLTAELAVSTDDGVMTPSLSRRALTTAGKYLVDVEVFGMLDTPDYEHFDAAAVAHATVDKIDRLTGRAGR